SHPEPQVADLYGSLESAPVRMYTPEPDPPATDWRRRGVWFAMLIGIAVGSGSVVSWLGAVAIVALYATVAPDLPHRGDGGVVVVAPGGVSPSGVTRPAPAPLRRRWRRPPRRTL
ncbi:MAG: hypothetical protein ABMB14_40170, partial [Myxococcota bacterium]